MGSMIQDLDIFGEAIILLPMKNIVAKSFCLGTGVVTYLGKPLPGVLNGLDSNLPLFPVPC